MSGGGPFLLSSAFVGDDVIVEVWGQDRIAVGGRWGGRGWVLSGTVLDDRLWAQTGEIHHPGWEQLRELTIGTVVRGRRRRCRHPHPALGRRYRNANVLSPSSSFSDLRIGSPLFDYDNDDNNDDASSSRLPPREPWRIGKDTPPPPVVVCVGSIKFSKEGYGG